MEITQLSKIFQEDYCPTEKELDEIRKWSETFPYMQSLHWILAKFDPGAHPQKAILYKTDPILFAQWFNKSAAEVIKTPLSKVQHEELDTEPSHEVGDLNELVPDNSQNAALQNASEEVLIVNQDKLPETLNEDVELKKSEIQTETVSEADEIKSADEKPQTEEFIQMPEGNLKDAIEPAVQPVEEEDDILALIHDLPNAIPLATDLEGLMPKVEEPEAEAIQTADEADQEDEDRSLMVMMSFQDWLKYFKNKKEKDREEEEGRRALRTAWQKEKLTAAIEEETDDIPEPIFKQAMESISNETGVISESLALVLAKQGKTDKAIEMYRKLSLRNPEKSAYFAALIQNLRIKQ